MIGRVPAHDTVVGIFEVTIKACKPVGKFGIFLTLFLDEFQRFKQIRPANGQYRIDPNPHLHEGVIDGDGCAPDEVLAGIMGTLIGRAEEAILNLSLAVCVSGNPFEMSS